MNYPHWSGPNGQASDFQQIVVTWLGIVAIYLIIAVAEAILHG